MGTHECSDGSQNMCTHYIKFGKEIKKVEMQNTSLIWTPDNFKKKMNATCSKDLFI